MNERITIHLEAIKNVKLELNNAINNKAPINEQLSIMIRLETLRLCLESELEKEAA